MKKRIVFTMFSLLIVTAVAANVVAAFPGRMLKNNDEDRDKISEKQIRINSVTETAIGTKDYDLFIKLLSKKNPEASKLITEEKFIEIFEDHKFKGHNYHNNQIQENKDNNVNKKMMKEVMYEKDGKIDEVQQAIESGNYYEWHNMVIQIPYGDKIANVINDDDLGFNLNNQFRRHNIKLMNEIN